jgi:hypothetical protein
MPQTAIKTSTSTITTTKRKKTGIEVELEQAVEKCKLAGLKYIMSTAEAAASTKQSKNYTLGGKSHTSKRQKGTTETYLYKLAANLLVTGAHLSLSSTMLFCI